jgi:hypothetical protein
MNWYKTALLSDNSYFSIGHVPDKETYIWAYRKFRLFAYLIKNGNDIHPEIWPDMKDTDYRGGFEKETKLCSVINPFRGQPIDRFLIEELKEKFGSDIKIVEFNW